MIRFPSTVVVGNCKVVTVSFCVLNDAEILYDEFGNAEEEQEWQQDACEGILLIGEEWSEQEGREEQHDGGEFGDMWCHEAEHHPAYQTDEGEHAMEGADLDLVAEHVGLVEDDDYQRHEEHDGEVDEVVWRLGEEVEREEVELRYDVFPSRHLVEQIACCGHETEATEECHEDGCEVAQVHLSHADQGDEEDRQHDDACRLDAGSCHDHKGDVHHFGGRMAVDENLDELVDRDIEQQGDEGILGEYLHLRRRQREEHQCVVEGVGADGREERCLGESLCRDTDQDDDRKLQRAGYPVGQCEEHVSLQYELHHGSVVAGYHGPHDECAGGEGQHDAALEGAGE